MSAALPSLGRLSLQPARVVATGALPTKKPGSVASGPGLHDLPPELLGLIFKAIDTDNPCATVQGLCDSDTLWRGWCRDGWIFDVANYALGYYGTFATWEQVAKFYSDIRHKQIARAIPNRTNMIAEGAATTPRAYFQQACRARFLLNERTQGGMPLNLLMGVAQHHPFYGARLLQQMQPLNLYAGFQFVPDDLWNYSAIAKLAVQKGPYALQYVPKNRDDYGEIAKMAVQSYGGALVFVPKDRDDYGDLAKLAVQNSESALETVPNDRDDYGEIAKVAVQNGHYALRLVSNDRADYGEIAMEAVQSYPDALQWVPTDHADYGAIAELAAQVAWAKAGRDLTNLRIQELPDFGAIAKIAVKEDGMALKDVPTDRDDYGAIARLALKENGDALEYVPENRDDYDELAEIAGNSRLDNMGP